ASNSGSAKDDVEGKGVTVPPLVVEAPEATPKLVDLFPDNISRGLDGGSKRETGGSLSAGTEPAKGPGDESHVSSERIRHDLERLAAENRVRAGHVSPYFTTLGRRLDRAWQPSIGDLTEGDTESVISRVMQPLLGPARSYGASG